MKRVVFFEPQRGGHRTVFIRWIADEIQRNPPDGFHFVFFIAGDDGPACTGQIEVHRISEEASAQLERAGRREKMRRIRGLFMDCYRQYQPDHVLILEMTFLEGSLALYGAPCPVSAIVFVQYPEIRRGLKFLLKHVKTVLLLHRAPIHTLFFLNGERSCAWLQDRFHRLATQFVPLPDAAVEADPDPGLRLRELFGIASERRVFLFFGAISRRKGAGVLIRALERLPAAAVAGGTFLFCGEPERGYEGSFASACERLRQKRPDLSLIVEPRYVSEKRMAAMFTEADVILMPYMRPEYSSGILALAARFGKPVIGPQGGLLGRLISENGLGVVCPVRADLLAECIACAVRNLPPVDPAGCSAFAGRSRPEHFASKLVDALCGGI